MNTSYEFDDAQNQTIARLARSMQTVGFVMMFFGVLGLLGFALMFVEGGFYNYANPLESAVLALFGFWTRRAGNSFEAIVRTQGADVRHLMSALGDLGKMYGLVRAVIVFVL